MLEPLHNAAGPANLDVVDFGISAKAEVCAAVA
jgi:hypothetical protein